MLLRRDELNAAELAAFEALYPAGTQFEFIRMDPANHQEHVHNCMKVLARNTDVVCLPMDKPIPSTAMEQGYIHVTVTPKGVVKRLRQVVPDFVDFEPDVPAPSVTSDAKRYATLVIAHAVMSVRGLDVSVVAEMIQELQRRIEG